jgi:Mrp family chromosome partitioning ATPase
MPFKRNNNGYREDVARIQSRLVMHMDEHSFRVVSVFGLTRGAGVTTLAAWVAEGLAAQSLPVVLVDADTTSASIHRMFHVAQTPGLSDLLTSATSPGGALRATHVPSLNVISAGNWPTPFPSVLPERWKKLFAPLRDAHRLVIVDAGNVNSTYADGIAHASDGVVLVLERGRSPWEDVAGFAARMEEMDVHFIGVVLNKRRDFGPRLFDR